MRITRNTPNPVPLKRGPVYCELDKSTIDVGDLVAWWPIRRGNRTMKTAYCLTCHWRCVKAGKALH